MTKIGSFLFLIGVFAIILDFLGRVPKILFWIYNWGDTMAWVIKIALVVLGVALFFMGNKKEVTSKE